MGEISQTLSDLSTEVESLEDKIEELESEREDLEDAKNEALESVHGLEERISELELELAEAIQNNDDLHKDISGHESKICDLQAEIKDHQEEVDELYADIYKLDRFAYHGVIALCIVNRLVPDKYKDIINTMMSVSEVKMDIDKFIATAHKGLIVMGHSEIDGDYQLPTFDQKEITNEGVDCQDLPKV
jgi:chromosome segregation ATPase